jgi:hypothetical protein
MTAEIRRPENGTDTQIEQLKEIRNMFDPNWLQCFDTGDMCVSFDNDDPAAKSFETLIEMAGYEMKMTFESAGETDYIFGK